MPQAALEHEELHRIFAEYFDDVWRFLVRLGASSSDAEDLSQEVFVVVHRRLSSFDRSRSMRAWLFGIARNVLRDHRRLARHRRETFEGELDEERSDPQFRALESANVVRVGLRGLPEPLRAVVILHDLEELEMREAADALEIPLDTAYARLRRGRELLRAAIAEREGGAS